MTVIAVIAVMNGNCRHVAVHERSSKSQRDMTHDSNDSNFWEMLFIGGFGASKNAKIAVFGGLKNYPSVIPST